MATKAIKPIPKPVKSPKTAPHKAVTAAVSPTRRTKPSKKPVKKVSGAGRDANGLLPKQAKFVTEYLKDGNATQAAIRAGYSPNSARFTASELLTYPNISGLLSQKQTAIAARQDERLAAMELTEERTLREIARIAYFDPRKMFHADGRPKAITELDDDTAAAIGGLEVMESFEGSGEDRRLVGVIKKYKVSDKNSALDKAAKIHGQYKKDNEQPGDRTANAIVALIKTMGRSSLPVVEHPDA